VCVCVCDENIEKVGPRIANYFLPQLKFNGSILSSENPFPNILYIYTYVLIIW
jgi:hypothetical protein